MKESYSVLLGNESEIDEIPPSKKDEDCSMGNSNAAVEHQRLLKQCFFYICLPIIFMLACTTIIVMISTTKCRSSKTTMPVAPQQVITEANHLTPTKTATNCGNSAEMALERGCHFDIISFVWTPHECFDHELMEQFSQENTWEWSLDASGTELISEEEIRKGNIYNGWVTFEYHLTHCLYTWKKLVRDVMRGGPMDGYVTSYNHTRHCSGLLIAEGQNRKAWNSEFFVQYPLCGV